MLRVRSVEPSFMTTISAPGTHLRTDAMTLAMEASSLKAGIIIRILCGFIYLLGPQGRISLRKGLMKGKGKKCGVTVCRGARPPLAGRPVRLAPPEFLAYPGASCALILAGSVLGIRSSPTTVSNLKGLV